MGLLRLVALSLAATVVAGIDVVPAVPFLAGDVQVYVDPANPSGTAGGAIVDLAGGESFPYGQNIPAGTYSVTYNVAGAPPGQTANRPLKFWLALGGAACTGTQTGLVSIENTTNWGDYKPYTGASFTVPSTVTSWRLCVGAGWASIQSMVFNNSNAPTPTTAPVATPTTKPVAAPVATGGATITIPCVPYKSAVQVYENNAVNNGGIDAKGNLVDLSNGENYTYDVTLPVGTYSIQYFVAGAPPGTAGAAGDRPLKFWLALGSAACTGAQTGLVSIAATTDWDNYTPYDGLKFTVAASVTTLKLCVGGGWSQIKKFVCTNENPTPTTAPVASPTVKPVATPTTAPATVKPVADPTAAPTTKPVATPTAAPTTAKPVVLPTAAPTKVPSVITVPCVPYKSAVQVYENNAANNGGIDAKGNLVDLANGENYSYDVTLPVGTYSIQYFVAGAPPGTAGAAGDRPLKFWLALAGAACTGAQTGLVSIAATTTWDDYQPYDGSTFTVAASVTTLKLCVGGGWSQIKKFVCTNENPTPTTAPVASPTAAPTTAKPVATPTTAPVAPTPPTSAPTAKPVTAAPVTTPTTAPVTPKPVTAAPTTKPVGSTVITCNAVPYLAGAVQVYENNAVNPNGIDAAGNLVDLAGGESYPYGVTIPAGTYTVTYYVGGAPAGTAGAAGDRPLKFWLALGGAACTGVQTGLVSITATTDWGNYQPYTGASFTVASTTTSWRLCVGAGWSQVSKMVFTSSGPVAPTTTPAPVAPTPPKPTAGTITRVVNLYKFTSRNPGNGATIDDDGFSQFSLGLLADNMWFNYDLTTDPGTIPPGEYIVEYNIKGDTTPGHAALPLIFGISTTPGNCNSPISKVTLNSLNAVWTPTYYQSSQNLVVSNTLTTLTLCVTKASWCSISSIRIGTAPPPIVNSKVPAAWLQPGMTDSQRVDELMKVMSLDEKLGQMNIGLASTLLGAVDRGNDVSRFYLGASIPGGTFTTGNGGLPASSWISELTVLQEKAVCNTNLKIPIIFGMDSVHGHGAVLDGTTFPHNIGLGAICAGKADKETCSQFMYDIGKYTAQEVKATGGHQIYAPTICMPEDFRWGRSYECYSQDPDVNSAYMRIIDGIQSEGLIATPKHFGSDGATRYGTGWPKINTGDAPTSSIPKQFKPYVAAINTYKAKSTMPSFSSIDNVKMTQNGYLNTQILHAGCPNKPWFYGQFTSTKTQCGITSPNPDQSAAAGLDKMNFGGTTGSCENGFVVTDWQAVNFLLKDGVTDFTQMVNFYSQQLAFAVNAGSDMIMAPTSYTDTIEKMKSAICLNDNTKDCNCISMNRINEAVRRILTVKASTGILMNPWPVERSDCGSYSRNIPDANRIMDENNPTKLLAKDLARKVAEQSQVLLKNVGGVLPLPKTNDIWIVLGGLAADDIGALCGGWTIDWQGRIDRQPKHNTGSQGTGKWQSGTTVKEAMQAMATVHVVSAPNQVGTSDMSKVFGVVVAGEYTYSEGWGDIKDLNWATLPTLKLHDGIMPYDDTLDATIHDIRDNGAYCARSSDPRFNDAQTVNTICNGSYKCVVVIVAGRPMDILSSVLQNSKVDAVVHAFLPGNQGGPAIVNKLFALTTSKSSTYWDYEGHMPVNWPVDFANPFSNYVFTMGYGCSTLAASSSYNIQCAASSRATHMRTRRLRKGTDAIDVDADGSQTVSHEQ